MSFGPVTQTQTPLPVQDFTPQANYPAFTSLVNQYMQPATYTNAANNTLLTSDVLGGFITHTTAGAQTDTMPTAAQLVPLIQGGRAEVAGVTAPGATSGSFIEFYVTAGGAGAITIAVGTGGTLVGSGVVAAGQRKLFRLVINAKGSITALPTYTLYSMLSTAF